MTTQTNAPPVQPGDQIPPLGDEERKENPHGGPSPQKLAQRFRWAWGLFVGFEDGAKEKRRRAVLLQVWAITGLTVSVGLALISEFKPAHLFGVFLGTVFWFILGEGLVASHTNDPEPQQAGNRHQHFYRPETGRTGILVGAIGCLLYLLAATTSQVLAVAVTHLGIPGANSISILILGSVLLGFAVLLTVILWLFVRVLHDA